VFQEISLVIRGCYLESESADGGRGIKPWEAALRNSASCRTEKFRRDFSTWQARQFYSILFDFNDYPPGAVLRRNINISWIINRLTPKFEYHTPSLFTSDQSEEQHCQVRILELFERQKLIEKQRLSLYSNLFVG
jgi:hypothetical protein